MTLIIVAIFLVCCILIATEKFTNVNKSAAAIFAVHEAFSRMLLVEVNEFFVPSALRRRWNAIF